MTATFTAYRHIMTCCAYCGQRATLEIPSTPGQVCVTHAIEFWTGLLAHVKDRSAEFQTPEQPDATPLRNTSLARSPAKAATEASTLTRENGQIRLAS
jgi:hypothetical protein